MDDPHAPDMLLIDTRLGRAFRALVGDMSYSSESDEPYEEFGAPMPKTAPLTEETFGAPVSIEPEHEITMPDLDPDCGSDSESVETYALLRKVMVATLHDLWHVSVRVQDTARMHVYVFGRTEDGHLAGLRSMATWM